MDYPNSGKKSLIREVAQAQRAGAVLRLAGALGKEEPGSGPRRGRPLYEHSVIR